MHAPTPGNARSRARSRAARSRDPDQQGRNPPALTDAFFGPAPRPKFELELLGAEHLPPYTSQQPQLSIVERVSVDFLDAYLRHEPGALDRMRSAAAIPNPSELIAEP